MDCRNHPGTAAAGTCAGCAESYCESCLVAVRGARYCASCKGIAVAGVVPLGDTPCKEASDALKLAILGFFCFGIVLGPLAISRALGAKKKIAADPALTGSGRANAAILLGSIAVVLWVLAMFQRMGKVGR